MVCGGMVCGGMVYMYGVWKDGESYTHNECLRLLIHHT